MSHGVGRRPLLAGILVLAAVLRLYGLGARDTLWEDEVALWSYVLTGDASLVPHESPLYAWMLFGWMWWTHEPTANTMQLLSIGLGVLDVVGAYILGRMLAGVRAGLVTAALVAIAPLALYLSHEVRPYTLYIFTSTLLIAAWIRAWERDDLRSWMLYGAALLVALHSHLLVSQLCVALGATALGALWLERDRSGGGARFLRFAAASLAAGLPGIVWLLLRPEPPLVNQGAHTDGIVDFLLRGVQTLGGSRPTLTFLSLGVTAIAGVGLVVLSRRRATRALLLASVIVVSGGITFVSMAPVSSAGWLGWQRYLSHLLVPFLALAAIGSLWLADRVAGAGKDRGVDALRTAIALLPAALMVPGTLHWLASPDRHPGTANMEQYALFVCEEQHDAIGILLYERVHNGEPWLSIGHTRRRDALHLARHDYLPSYGIGPHGIYGLQNTPGRAGIAELPRPVALDAPPPDGRYIVFPPSVGCKALMKPPLEGITSSRRIKKSQWGRVCELRFAPDAALRPNRPEPAGGAAASGSD